MLKGMTENRMSEVKKFDFFEDLHLAYKQCVVTTNKKQSHEFRSGLQIAIDLISRTGRLNKKVMFIGNGGSASIASHLSVDLWKNGDIDAIAFNDSSLLTCISNDFGYEHVFEQPILRFGKEDDLLIAISSSGNSENIIRGIKAARDKKCQVITFTGFSECNKIRNTGDLNFYIPSHSYGIVEVGHLALLHGMLDEMLELQKEKLTVVHHTLTEA